MAGGSMIPPRGPGVPPRTTPTPGPTTGSFGPTPSGGAEGPLKASVAKTVRVPQVSERNAAPIHRAGKIPVAVTIRNIGAATVFLAVEFSGAIAAAGLPGSDSYQLPVGTERTIVLAAEQLLYGACVVIGRVTLWIADARIVEAP